MATIYGKGIVEEVEMTTDDVNVLSRIAHRRGMMDAASWISQFDGQLASSVNGYRFSDMLLCKFNLTKLKKPRKARKS
jgi:hypothetical protein